MYIVSNFSLLEIKLLGWACTNLCMNMCFFFFLSSKYLEMEWLDYKLGVTCKEIIKMFSRMVVCL